MKIAILAPVYWTYDGISRVVETQASTLSQDNDVEIFTFSTNMAPPENVVLHIIGMPSNDLGARIYWILFPFNLSKTMSWVRKLKGFDVVISHQYPTTWVSTIAKWVYGIKYIYYNHGIATPDTFPNFIERTYMRIAVFMENLTIQKADEAVSISDYLRRQLKNETGIDSEVVYDKIDRTRFHRALDGSPIRNKYGINDVPMVLFVGRISPHKGIHLLIEAFNAVKKRIPNAKLVIVGNISFVGYYNKLKKMSDSSVIFVGKVSDEELPLFYAACNLYATASLWEGFNLPLVEAQACGKPVIAFNIGPHPEVVTNETVGILVPYKNTEKFACAMVEVLERNK
jgi:glycosyltransferase involved in cell wall biosynthesis